MKMDLTKKRGFEAYCVAGCHLKKGRGEKRYA